MIKTIRLYGHLGHRFGEQFKFDVRSPAEAICALRSQLPGFTEYLLRHNAPGYKVVTGKAIVSNVKLLSMQTGQDVIKIIPVVAGSGGDSPFGIILGVALIIMSGGFGAVALIPGAMGSIAMSMGVSLVLGGISAMLSDGGKSSPQASQRPQNIPSYAFNGAVNVTQQGNPVPIFLGGPMVIGSQVISAGLHADQQAAGGGGEEETSVDLLLGDGETYVVVDDDEFINVVRVFRLNEEGIDTTPLTLIPDQAWTDNYQYSVDTVADEVRVYIHAPTLETYRIYYNHRRP